MDYEESAAGRSFATPAESKHSMGWGSRWTIAAPASSSPSGPGDFAQTLEFARGVPSPTRSRRGRPFAEILTTHHKPAHVTLSSS